MPLIRRRTVRRMILATAGIVTGAASASAQDTETWRCDAGYGQHDERMITIPPSARLVTGRLNFHRAYTGAEWASEAKVTLSGADGAGEDCGCKGITAMGYPDSGTVEFDLNANGGFVPVSARKFETAITFRIAIAPDGTMTVQIGKDTVDSKSVILRNRSRSALQLSCSGADVSFLNLSVE